MNSMSQNAVAHFQPPRLPYNAILQERFGVDASGWKALVEAIYPLAKTADSVAMALSYCKARKLDPFKKPVHIVPMWDAKANNGDGGYVETVWPGISEIRTTAFRTAQYAGCDETEFGPEIEKTFVGQKDKWENRRKVGTETVEVTLSFPEWARITVYREMGGKICKFVGPKVYWVESYASQGKVDVPNTMWSDRPIGQIEKCAEAAALRKAFPEELGNQLTAEEMEGRRVEGDFGGAEITEPVRRQPPAPPKAKVDAEDAHVVDGAQAGSQAAAPAEKKAEPAKAAAKQNEKPAAPKKTEAAASQADEQYNAAPILKKIEELFAEARDADHLEEIRAKKAMPLYERLKRSDQEAAIVIYQTASARFEPTAGEGEQAEAGDAAPSETAGEIEADGSVEDGSEVQRGRGSEADDGFPGDRKDTADGPKPIEQMSVEEYKAHVNAYVTAATDPNLLKRQWFDEAGARDTVLGPTHELRRSLKTIVMNRVDELNDKD